MEKNHIGKRVTINRKRGADEWNNEYKGAWGVVADFDGEYYHVQMFCENPNDCNTALIFTKSELSFLK